MLSSSSLPLLATALLAPSLVAANQYSQTDSFQGNDFLNTNNFQFITKDEAGGYVNYVNKATAQSEGLVSVSGSSFKMGVDYKKTPSASAVGRDSVRLQSIKQWEYHVSIYNVAHMPQGCGTWPALWEVGDSWETDGEIDILEGVNTQEANYVTLHVGSQTASCTIPDTIDQTGWVEDTDCDHKTSDSGCSVGLTEANNYGVDFNSNGGGFYAMEQNPNFVKVWFWPRSASNIPADVKNGVSTINTDNWGTPSAYFPNTHCDIASHFHARNILMNIDLCGDWASGEFEADGCGTGTCNDYVRNNPSAFQNAYFDINWVKVFQ
ncbi:glycoside hydrolase family 16 protein [Peniophora sp. CONT]|nr:glycoside hydrolase family 16 protein [Peniophora sp. CONT]